MERECSFEALSTKYRTTNFYNEPNKTHLLLGVQILHHWTRSSANEKSEAALYKYPSTSSSAARDVWRKYEGKAECFMTYEPETTRVQLCSRRAERPQRLARWQHLLDAIMCWEAPRGPHPPQSAPSRACWQLGAPPCAAVLPSCSRTRSTAAQKPPPTPPPVCSLSPSQASAMLPPPRLQIQFLMRHLPAEAFSRKGGISPTLF